jgi:hypothetical protein
MSKNLSNLFNQFFEKKSDCKSDDSLNTISNQEKSFALDTFPFPFGMDVEIPDITSEHNEFLAKNVKINLETNASFEDIQFSGLSEEFTNCTSTKEMDNSKYYNSIEHNKITSKDCEKINNIPIFSLCDDVWGIVLKNFPIGQYILNYNGVNICTAYKYLDGYFFCFKKPYNFRHANVSIVGKYKLDLSNENYKIQILGVHEIDNAFKYGLVTKDVYSNYYKLKINCLTCKINVYHSRKTNCPKFKLIIDDYESEFMSMDTYNTFTFNKSNKSIFFVLC